MVLDSFFWTYRCNLLMDFTHHIIIKLLFYQSTIAYLLNFLYLCAQNKNKHESEGFSNIE